MFINTVNATKIGVELQRSQQAISRSLQRLSTGKRVNSPQDDPAAFNLITNLQTQIRGLNQGIRNVNDAVGLLETASSAITVQLDIVQRMREIGIQAGNGALTTADRNGLHAELQSLFQEFRRITSETEFNGTKLLDGTFGTKTLQIGADSGNTTDIDIRNLSASATFLKTIGTGTFATRTTVALAANSGPRSVIVDDFNNDGKQDFITGDAGSAGSVFSVFIGKGNGTFLTRITFSGATAGGNSYLGMTAGDINGDGTKDLVVQDSNAGTTVSVFIGNGDGTFKPRTTVTTGSAPSAVELADLNNDGDLDLVVADSGAAQVSVLLGNGDGTFQSRLTTTVGTTPYDLRTGDLNGDGILDIVTANAGSANVSVILGNGDGTFQAAVNTSVQTAPRGVELGDLDGDGDLDVVATNNTTGSVSVLLNNGVGTLGAAANTAVGTTPEKSRLGDINGDGILDILVAEEGSLYIGILLGNGNGTFQARTTISSAGGGADGITDLRLNDFNGDGVLDIVTADYTAAAGSTASIHLGNSKTADGSSDIDVRSQVKATKLVKILDTVLNTLRSEQADLASYHVRLEQAVNYNGGMVESYTTALGLAEDADIAEETTNLTRNQILQQAQVAALSQANLNMQTVLSLLRVS